MKAKLTAVALTTLVAANSAYAGGSVEVVLAAEVEWEQFNPEGHPQYRGAAVETLAPGSYFGSEGGEGILYVRTDGKYDVVPAK